MSQEVISKQSLYDTRTPIQHVRKQSDDKITRLRTAYRVPWQAMLRSQEECLPWCPLTHSLWYIEPAGIEIAKSAEPASILTRYTAPIRRRQNLAVISGPWLLLTGKLCSVTVLNGLNRRKQSTYWNSSKVTRSCVVSVMSRRRKFVPSVLDYFTERENGEVQSVFRICWVSATIVSILAILHDIQNTSVTIRQAHVGFIKVGRFNGFCFDPLLLLTAWGARADNC